ncbi:hypothetical protein R1T40_11190 [Tritonibacter scottomollicae]|uniref:DUF4244 domain-containing protein n=1 Tax=Tritonibacter scottomollicae TaxID=483013 RepID=A0ABZ0HBV7_TRISK|nr:hypothetical protein [Tritonibacter scottomollicae]WOI31535.1 hypothetical protein R1T40_11190 [Tritonibacter scottomollicae]
MTTLKIFRSREDGAVSVDWVVLAAAMAALAFLAAQLMRGGTMDAVGSLADYLTNWTF